MCGEYVRRSLDLRSWEAASELVRGWEASSEVGVVKPEVPTVAEAVTKFIEDANARHLWGDGSQVKNFSKSGLSAGANRKAFGY